MKMKSKYADAIAMIKKIKIDPLKISDASEVIDELERQNIKVPLTCLDDTIADILDAFYKYMDTTSIYSITTLVGAYKINYEQFGCDPVSNYNFVVNSDKFIALYLRKAVDSGEISDLYEIKEIDIDDKYEWED